MAKSQETFNKKEKEKKRLQKRKEKEQRKEDRKANAKEGGSWEDIVIGIQRQDPSLQVSSVRRGKVTFFNTSKGFGFIKDTENGESIFVHSNGLMNPIKENDTVTFETERGFKGLNAVKVKLA
jgi:cold shock CspA family protein